MINSSIEADDTLLDWEVFSAEVIGLTPEFFAQAAEISDQVRGETFQWQTYLRALALLAFEQWLSERLPEIPVNRDPCSILQPYYATLIESVCNLKVGKFNFCLVATQSPVGKTVTVPRVALDLPEFIAHCYVILEILEEQQQVILRGFLRYDQLVQYRQSAHLEPKPDWQYELPLDLFDPKFNHLLFCLRVLAPTAIPLPIASAPHLLPSLTQDDLKTLLLELQASHHGLWKHLSWEQGVVVFSHPELLDLEIEKFPLSQLRSLGDLLNYLSKIRVFKRLQQWWEKTLLSEWQPLEGLSQGVEDLESFVDSSSFGSTDLAFTHAASAPSSQWRGPKVLSSPSSSYSKDLNSLIELLENSQVELVRRQVAGVLGEIGKNNPETISALTELLHSTQDPVRLVD